MPLSGSLMPMSVHPATRHARTRCDGPDGLRAWLVSGEFRALVVDEDQSAIPGDPEPARVRPSQALKALDGSGLARAVGSEQTENLVGLDLEGDVGNRHGPAVLLAQTTHLDDSRHSAQRPAQTPPCPESKVAAAPVCTIASVGPMDLIRGNALRKTITHVMGTGRCLTL